VALDAGTGAVLWERALPQAPSTGPVRIEDTIYVGLGNQGVLPINLLDGQPGQPIGCDGTVTGRLLTNSECLVALTVEGKAAVIDFVDRDEDTGRTLLAKRKPIENVIPDILPALTYDSLVYVVREKKDNVIRLYDFPVARQAEAAARKAKEAAKSAAKTRPADGGKSDPVLRVAKLQNRLGSTVIFGEVMPAPLGLLRGGVLVATEQKGLVYFELKKD